MNTFSRIPVKNRDIETFTLLDDVDVTRLGRRRLSLGSNRYAQMYDQGKVITVHRWVLGLTAGDGLIADHINGDKLDNRRSNLRAVTPSESSANVSGRGHSRFRGVRRHRNGWQARAKLGQHNIHLGTFATEEEAATAARAWRIANLPGYIDREVIK